MDPRIIAAVAAEGDPAYDRSWGAANDLMSEYARERHFEGMEELAVAWRLAHPRTIHQMTNPAGAWLRAAFISQGLSSGLIEAYTKSSPGWPETARSKLEAGRGFAAYAKVLIAELNAFRGEHGPNVASESVA